MLASLVFAATMVFASGSKEQVSSAPNAAAATSAVGSWWADSNPLSNPLVRQAIDYSINKEAILKDMLQGKAVVANSLVPNGAWKVSGLNDYPYDPAKARQLLKEAHWDPNRTITVVYYYGD